MAGFDELPILRPGEEPPGCFPRRPDGGSEPWRGEWSWRTLHGPATLVWTLGRRRSAHGVLLPDGNRAPEIETTMGSFHGPEEWRVPVAGGYAHGTLRVTDDDLVLTYEARRPRTGAFGEGDGPDMRDDLAADPAFVRRLDDEAFAVAAYVSFENVGFRKGASRRRFSVGFRTAAAFVAQVRGRGEDYVDFYCSRLDAVGADGEAGAALLAEFDAFVRTAGWHAVTEDEEEATRVEVRGLVSAWWGREGTDAAPWVHARSIREDVSGADGPADVYVAMRALAWSGRVSEEEYDLVLGML